MVATKGREELMQFLGNLSIETTTVEHPEVFTVETMMEHLKDVEGIVSKNLFLKDKKKKLYLLTALHSQDISLNNIAKKVGASGGLRFADESIMVDKLGVSQGCCTPLAVFNDSDKDVKVIVDSRFFDDGVTVYSHPMVNTASMGITAEGLKKFFGATGHVPIVINFNEI